MLNFYVRLDLTRESPIPVLEIPSAFHRRAQRNAFRCRDVRL